MGKYMPEKVKDCSCQEYCGHVIINRMTPEITFFAGILFLDHVITGRGVYQIDCNPDI